MVWTLFLVWSLALSLLPLPGQRPVTDTAPPGAPQPAMPCYPYSLAQITSQAWATYTCIETTGYAVGVRAEDYEGHEQVHLRLRDNGRELPAFWPAAQGALTEGQYVRVRAMFVPLVQGDAVVAWGLLIISWEPARAPLPDARQG